MRQLGGVRGGGGILIIGGGVRVRVRGGLVFLKN